MDDKLEPLAIVGMSWRFPGEAHSANGFWDVLSNGKSTRTRIPADRFKADAYYHPSADRQGSIITKEGHFLTGDIGAFDAPFFSMSAAEAEGMDPQHRILLEVTYEAFENGASLMVDTACSASLVALHLACQELRAGQSKMAVVAGTNIIIQPEVWRGLSALRFLSPDGTCHSFDSRANGYSRGEGVGTILIKPLADALRDNDVIRAVIRGTGINQDGKTPGITVPSSDAQVNLIRSTYEAAGLDFSRTTYFEAHGTGTAVGDPLEISAIGQTIGSAKTKNDYPLLVGSVKSNIGHLEGASGIAGVIKTVLALENGMIPAVHGFQTPNPRLRLEEWNILIPSELTPWPTSGLRRASVNSFGYGGTNAHLILDDAFHYLKGISLDEGDSLLKKDGTAKKKLFVFSSPEQDGLARMAQTYVEFIRSNSSLNDSELPLEKSTEMAALAYTLSERRTIFDWRSFAIAGSMESLAESLERTLPKISRAVKSPSCAFVFTGQGAQWFAMGRELQDYEVFKDSITAANEYISSLGCTWSVLEELNRDEDESHVNEPQISQPLCTVLQIALVDLLNHWGLRPKAVVGHSSGEIAAAYAAGILNKEGAWKVSYHRGVHSAEIPTLLPDRKGSMMAAGISEAAAQKYLDKATAGEAIVACINSPQSIEKLKVQTAYHSPHMKVIAEKYLESVRDVLPSEQSNVSFFSSVTGSEISHVDMGAEYWVKNLLSPVRFSEAVTALISQRTTRSRRKGMASVGGLIEIGPHSALQGPLRDIVADISESYLKTVNYTSVLQRGVDATESALHAAGRLWSLGFSLDLALVNSTSKTPVSSRALVNLPKYPFNHKRRYWNESRSNLRRRTRDRPRSDLLGQQVEDYNLVSPRWTNFLKPIEIPWLMDHRIQGMIVLPAAAMLAMVLEACQETANQSEVLQGYQFRDVSFHKAMLFTSPVVAIETVVELKPHNFGTKVNTSHWTHFSILSIGPDITSLEHCSGLVKTIYATKPNEIDNCMEATREWNSYKQEYLSIQEKPTKERHVGRVYDKLNGLGFQFGPLFRNITRVHSGDGFGYCELQIPDTAARMPENFEYPSPIHPTVLDGIFQMMACCGTVESDSPPMVPSFIESLYVAASLPSATGSILKGFSTLKPKQRLQQLGSVIVSDDSWNEPKILLKGFVCTELSSRSTKAPSRNICSHFDKLLNQHRFSLDPVLVRSASLCDQAVSEFIQDSLVPVSTEPEKEADLTLQSYIRWMRSVADMSYSSLSSTGSVASESSPTMEAIETNRGVKRGVISKFIDSSIGRPFVNSIMAEFMNTIGYVRPNMEVLEVGDSGSISCATSVLERLSGKTSGSARLTNYTFTDSKQETLASAQDLLEKWASIVELKVLDIEKDPEAQGFVLEKFDYIIFNELLLTTTDLGLGLRNLKKLLKPGGKLLLGAITKAQLRTTFVLGSDPRWWRNFNRSSALFGPLDEDGWDKVLKESGFVGVEHLIQDSGDAHVHQLSVMVSSVEHDPSFDFSEVIIVNPTTSIDGCSALSVNIANLLIKLGLSVTHRTLDTIGDVSGKVLISLLEVEVPVLEDISEQVFEAVKSMLLNSVGTLWITRGGQVVGPSKPYSGVSTGLFRALRSEDPDIRVGTLDLSSGLNLKSQLATNLVSEVFQSLFESSEREVRDHEFAEDNGCLYVPRLLEESGINSAIAEISKRPQPVMERLFQQDRPLKMVLGEPGLLNTLQFVDDEQFQEPLKSDYVEMKVLCTGLNFVDVMAALGQVPTPTLGCEAGGIITKVGSDVTKFKPGDKVAAGLVPGGFNTHVRIRQTFIQHVPPHMTIEGATTIMIAFLTAWIGLINKARIRRGETALIHSGAGGVGQAAIQICQHFGVEVYTTIGSKSKKELLMERYDIPEDHIFNSRDSSFAQGLKRMTKRRGVDVVLNSVSGELLRQSWHCLADFGRFIEIGKRDLLGNTGLDMEPFLRGVSYIGVNLEQFHPHHSKELFPITIYDYSQVEQAFRALQSGKFAGKIVVRANPDDIVPIVPRAKPPLLLDPNATYLLAGGLGGIGRSIADMLQSHGARHLAFFSRSGNSKEEAKAFLRQLRRHGCTANAYGCDISDREKMPPIKGLVQCSMVLRDGIFENTSYDDWITCTRPKIQGSWNLHEALPKDLDFFVMLSSISGVIGNPGQANYSAGNVYKYALAHFRRRQGAKAVALDLGAVRDVGYLAESEDTVNRSHLKFLQISETDIHHLVKFAIVGHFSSNDKVPPQVATGLASGEEMMEAVKRTRWARDAKFSMFWKTSGLNDPDDGIQAGLEAFKAESPGVAAAIVEDIIIARIAKVLMMSVEDISSTQPLHSYGVDTLIASEISVFDLLSPIPLSSLAMKIVLGSTLLPGKWKQETQEDDAPATEN
ncbi:putative lovastatin nonaketide synthase [Aspergillus alliaceus]|uniref:Putative lovastatin nonaketide synthase n=1 Tax=Petromyces alliaceus TaxID=209559 RepID=A0A5N7CK82_PETAA|nr:putative lovastatin nonaketide synthase [Aspergillus alliaceus]